MTAPRDYDAEFEAAAAAIQAKRAAEPVGAANLVLADGRWVDAERAELEGWAAADNDDRPIGQFVRPVLWRDPATMPRRQWLYGRHLIRKFVSATFAPGGVGKSALVLAEAMAMASGRAILGPKPLQRLRVGYWNGEDPFEETERRALAAAILHDLGPDDRRAGSTSAAVERKKSPSPNRPARGR